jgi:hypothetical protein
MKSQHGDIFTTRSHAVCAPDCSLYLADPRYASTDGAVMGDMNQQRLA